LTKPLNQTNLVWVWSLVEFGWMVAEHAAHYTAAKKEYSNGLDILGRLGDWGNDWVCGVPVRELLHATVL
jgi:hypothetical protein